MADRKIYTAFISSKLKSLEDEREAVIDCLLDNRILPICMEHFTVSSSGQFADIEKFIDESDIFIVLLGRYYGSCDENGISWTEREYDYALKKKKTIIAIVCDELIETLEQDPSDLSDDERKQIQFSDKVKFARTVSEKLDIKTIVRQGLESNLSKCAGWVRAESSMDPDALEEWREKNKIFDLAGNWYHVHLSDDDEQYIRVGTITISQDFTPDKYTDLKMTGLSYDILYYDEANDELKMNLMKKSRFDGEYKIEDDGTIFGIFSVKREFGSGSFNSQAISKGSRRGIHDFSINMFADTTESFAGEFHDEAPSPKMGSIFVYRSENERNQCLLDVRGDIIKRK